MARKKILFIGGSYNQTTMMHAVAKPLMDAHDCFFTPFYCGGMMELVRKSGLLDRSIAGFGNFYRDTMAYFAAQKLALDAEGKRHDYDLVVTCTDIMIPRNVQRKPLVVVQEGMTDPETLLYKATRALGLPRWLAVNTAATGLSNAYTKFCVASEGYRRHFAARGASLDKIVVTGIPNYDNAAQYLKNSFPHYGHVLVATSDTREAFKYENRRQTIREAARIANGRQLIFKLHPNEKRERATREIERWAPGALVFSEGNAHEMIANASAVITRFSTVVYTGLALGKEVHSKFNLEELKSLMPQQNGGTSARSIAHLCQEVMQ